MSTAATIGEAWERTHRRNASRTALIDLPSGQESTFRALQDQATRLAAALDPAPGRALALACGNHADWLAGFLAARFRGHCLIPLDAALPAPALDAEARRLGASWILRKDGLHPLPGIARPRRWKNAACLKLTSGTTGVPVSIPNQDRHLLADGRQVAATMGIRPQDRNLGLIPLGHSYALGNLVLPLIEQGTALALAPAFLPAQIPDWIQNHGLTVFPTVPAVLRALVDAPSVASLQGLRRVISAGAPLAPTLARAFQQKFGLIPHNFYGSSETGGICYDRDGRASLDGSSAGQPLHGVTVSLSRSGRVRVAGPAVATPEGTFLLRDIGSLAPDGSLQILGRAGAVANIGGKKVSPREIEAALRTLDGVADAVCWVRLAHGRHYLAAAAESALPLDTIRSHLAGLLPTWKIPRELHVLRTFPRNPRGKTDLPRLQARVRSAEK